MIKSISMLVGLQASLCGTFVWLYTADLGLEIGSSIAGTNRIFPKSSGIVISSISGTRLYNLRGKIMVRMPISTTDFFQVFHHVYGCTLSQQLIGSSSLGVCCFLLS